MITFRLFDPNTDALYIPVIWDDMRPKMQKAMRFWDGVADIDDIAALVMGGQFKIVQAFFITTTLATMLVEEIKYPKKNFVNIIFFTCAQDMDNTMQLLAEPLKFFIKEAGYDGVEIKARPGMVRTLKKLGLTTKLTGMIWNG